MSQKEISTETKKISISKDEINEYKEAFDIFDKNNTGIISTDDIIKIKKIFSYQISGDDTEKMIKEIDTSGNGKFDFKKFVIFMKKQIEYLEEKEENIALETIKDEYLGNKRKREKLSEENSKSDYDLKLLSNSNSILEEKYKNNEEMVINNENINSEISSNKVFKDKNNKKKSTNNNIIRIKINDDGTLENINTKIIIDLTSEKENEYETEKENSINIITKKNQNKRKRGINENNNSKNNLILNNNNILIYKENLPKELIDKIEQKNNNNNNSSIIKIPNNTKSHISIKDNSLSIQKPISSFSSKFIPEFDYINMSNGASIDSYRPPLFQLYGINSRFDKTPMINVKRRKKDNINYSSKKLLDGIREKLINKGVDFNNKNLNKKSPNKSRIKANLQKIVNNGFYGSENIEIDSFHSRISFDNINEFFNKSKLLYENSLNFLGNEIKMKEEKNNDNQMKEDIPQEQEKNNKGNIQILNTFELKYEQNKNKEKIIKKVIEIPYLIIINKNAFKMEEIKNYNNIEEPNSKESIKKDIKNRIKEDKEYSNFKKFEFIYSIDNDYKINEKYHKNIIILKKTPIIMEENKLDIIQNSNNIKNKNKIGNAQG